MQLGLFLVAENIAKELMLIQILPPEFASWLSPEFKLYLIKEFERLKDLENQNREWDVRCKKNINKE